MSRRYNRRDEPVARELARKLTGRGVKVWIDKEELKPGASWQEELEKVISSVPVATVLIGPDGIGPWENREMRACLDKFAKKPEKRSIIPVLLPGVQAEPELPLFLNEFAWVDLRKGLDSASLDLLVWGITGEKVSAS